jgi:hypothetical protein
MTRHIPVADLNCVWPALWPLLKPAVESSPDKPDVLAELLAHRADLWAVYEDGKPVAAIVTAKQEDGRCLVWLIGGARFREWVRDFLAVLEPTARAAGCTALWACGRRGWARWAPNYGWSRIADHNGQPAWQRRLA